MSTVTSPISNTEDIIDSRDVIARIEYLEPEHGGCCSPECEDDHHEDDCPDKCEETHYCTSCSDGYEHEEFTALKALAEEASGYAPDWQYGEALIRDSYFRDYAEQLADDLGLISDTARWPATCIDWERAADELKQDYTEVDFDGTSYYIRS
jgi:hypothetical protein